jgi:hypothetical protein
VKVHEPTVARIVTLSGLGNNEFAARAGRWDRPESKLIKAVSGGWQRILSNLECLPETGQIILKA